MSAPNLFCSKCGGHTPHTHLVNSYATMCQNCGNVTSQLERVHMESQQYTAPDGEPGVVVENNDRTVVFYIEKGEYAGYYVYDKATGFGAIQSHYIAGQP